ncbi:MAG: acetylglutamate kinase [bacterium]
MNIAVLKLSGKALNEIFTNDKWIDTIVNLKNSYDGLIIVHGAGQNISEWSAALGLEARFIDGQRVTTEQIMDVVAAVQSGVLNSKIVSRLLTNGIDSVGVSGIDRGTFIAENLNLDLGHVGIPVVSGSVDWIIDLMNNNVIPVFSSVCRSKTGSLMNVNADLFTEVLAAAVSAETVFFVSDVNGVKLSGIYQLYVNEYQINEGINSKEITDGMIPKLTSCVKLLNKGIKKVWIGKNIQMNYEDDFQTKGGTWIVKSA